MKNNLQTCCKVLLLALFSAGSINLFGQSLVSANYRDKHPALSSYASEDDRQEPGESVQLESVLKEFEADYKINFAYDGQVLTDKYVLLQKLKEARGKEENVDKMLDYLLKPLALGYTKINKVYVIYKADEKEVKPLNGSGSTTIHPKMKTE